MGKNNINANKVLNNLFKNDLMAKMYYIIYPYNYTKGLYKIKIYKSKPLKSNNALKSKRTENNKRTETANSKLFHNSKSFEIIDLNSKSKSPTMNDIDLKNKNLEKVNEENSSESLICNTNESFNINNANNESNNINNYDNDNNDNNKTNNDNNTNINVNTNNNTDIDINTNISNDVNTDTNTNTNIYTSTNNEETNITTNNNTNKNTDINTDVNINTDTNNDNNADTNTNINQELADGNINGDNHKQSTSTINNIDEVLISRKNSFIVNDNQRKAVNQQSQTNSPLITFRPVIIDYNNKPIKKQTQIQNKDSQGVYIPKNDKPKHVIYFLFSFFN